MFQALKLVRPPQNPIFSSSLPSLGRKTAAVSFTQANCSSTSLPDSEKKMSSTQKEEDVMSRSFGEGYSTRSDEEGFGGIYGGNQSLKKKEEEEDSTQKEEDVMSHSFGKGYSTRSDEEGFGGIYGGNQSLKKKEDNTVNENHPDYDMSQGSAVKEKEKARNQAHETTTDS